jgi:hypothetical protein
MTASTGYPATMNHTPGTDADDSVSVEFLGVRVTITKRTAEMNEAKGTKDAILVLIDTEFEDEQQHTLSIQTNDWDTWEGPVN